MNCPWPPGLTWTRLADVGGHRAHTPQPGEETGAQICSVRRLPWKLVKRCIHLAGPPADSSSTHCHSQVVSMPWSGAQDEKCWLHRGCCACSRLPHFHADHSRFPRLMGLLEAELRTLSLLEAPLPGDVVSWVHVYLASPSTQFQALINSGVSRHLCIQALC